MKLQTECISLEGLGGDVRADDDLLIRHEDAAASVGKMTYMQCACARKNLSGDSRIFRIPLELCGANGISLENWFYSEAAMLGILLCH